MGDRWRHGTDFKRQICICVVCALIARGIHRNRTNYITARRKRWTIVGHAVVAITTPLAYTKQNLWACTLGKKLHVGRRSVGLGIKREASTFASHRRASGQAFTITRVNRNSNVRRGGRNCINRNELLKTLVTVAAGRRKPIH